MIAFASLGAANELLKEYTPAQQQLKVQEGSFDPRRHVLQGAYAETWCKARACITTR